MEVTMISRGVEIPITGGVEETKDANYCDHFFHLFFLFLSFFIFIFIFFYFLNHMHLFKVQREIDSFSGCQRWFRQCLCKQVG